MVKKKMNNPLTVGVDLGGTKLNVALVNCNGNLLSSHKSLIHASKEPKMVISDIIQAIDRFRSETNQEPEALGVGIAAQVDQEGVVCNSPNLGWQNIFLKKILEKELELPVIVINDANAAAWGEWRYGSGRDTDNLAVIFVGTGVGGGIITGGKLLSGCTNSGGELGHITIVYNGRKCHCPNRGCLEAYAGGWAIAERARQAIKTEERDGQYLAFLAGSIEKVTAATVSQAYRKGDLLARKLVDDTGRYLAAGVVSIVNIFNPCVLVLGGGVIEGTPELIQIVKDFTQIRALEESRKKLKIVKAALAGDAGAIGAAALAQDLVK
jgi:glucokinase